MIYYHKLNLGFNNSNLVSFRSFIFASCDMKNIYIYLSFLYHYFHNPLPETDTKPRASPIVSYVKLLGINVIQEPPIYFNAFNIFFSYHSIIQNSLFLQFSQFFIFLLLFLHPLMPILHFPQPLSLIFLWILWLPPQAVPFAPVRFSLTGCLLSRYHSALIRVITWLCLTLKSTLTYLCLYFHPVHFFTGNSPIWNLLNNGCFVR